jgi:hypothetical protein
MSRPLSEHGRKEFDSIFCKDDSENKISTYCWPVEELDRDILIKENEVES